MVLKSETRDQVASAYDDWSLTYESVENRTRDLAAQAMRQQALALQDRDLLEIGCGTGLNTGYLAEHCRSVVALDFSVGMLNRARANVSASNVRFIESDIRRRWSADDAAFDLIVSALVLEHIENLPHIFSEAARVLRPGGEFLIFELHPFRQLQGSQAQFKRTDADEVVLIPAYLHSISDFVNTSLECGFHLLRIDEWLDAKDQVKTGIPRLLSLRLRASS
jgi:malonyl-CoA O-methyltransferase